MLTKTNQPQDSDHNEMHGHLVKCVTSATSIIAIFDLFCRTYSLNYCVLSLAYSVYVASSIFLLQIQATPDNQQALQRLEFCIQCLGQVKSFSPGKPYYSENVFSLADRRHSHWKRFKPCYEGANEPRYLVAIQSTPGVCARQFSYRAASS